jgi:CheY-like chemotaxis protein
MSGEQHGDGPPSAPETLLVVDAEVLVRMTISAYLRECGYRVVEAVNAEEALAVLGQTELSLKAVLADTALPGPMDGFALARWIREHRVGLNVLLAGTPARAAERAADLCEQGPELGRPYEPVVVVDRIRRLLAEWDKRGRAAPNEHRLRPPPLDGNSARMLLRRLAPGGLA